MSHCDMRIPEISSEWKVLFRPQKHGSYVNDHTIFQDGDGWRLIGITGEAGGGPYSERYFINASSNRLDLPFEERGKLIDTGTLCWAPCVVKHDGLYFMYYGPSPTKMAVSVDATEWMGYEIQLNAPFLACHRDHFVLQIGESEWLMYASGVTPAGLGSICCLKSTNLLSWSFCTYALIASEKAPLKPAWGALESPYVVKIDGLFYLFVTYTDCSDENYNDTLVFVSENPLSFGIFQGDKDAAVPVTKLHAHAPELISYNGEYFITTCGWSDKPNPNPGCVSIARLSWV